jgi:hypothetical protein
LGYVTQLLFHQQILTHVTCRAENNRGIASVDLYSHMFETYLIDISVLLLHIYIYIYILYPVSPVCGPLALWFASSEQQRGL